MAKENINQDVLDQLLVEVTGEIAEYLRKDEAALRKAVDEDGAPAPDEESEGSEGPAAPMESSAGGETPPEMGDDGMGAPDGSPMMDEASAAPEGTAAHEGGEIEPAPSVEGLQSEYMKLDPEALKMHYLACKEALMAQMGAGPEASAPPAPEASVAPPAPPAPAPAAPAFKAEAVPSGKEMSSEEEANGGEVEKGKALGKSEANAEIVALKQRLAKSEADKSAIEAQALELAVKLTAPLRKSIKGLSDLQFVPKEVSTEKKSPSQGLSKNEIVSKLREKARTETLKKSDRDLINQYTVGMLDVSKIEYLLVD